MQRLSVLAFVASLIATPAYAIPGLVQRADTCQADNCYRALLGNKVAVSSDCSSFMRTTVSPAALTSTSTVVTSINAPAVTVTALAGTSTVTNIVTSYTPVLATVQKVQVVTQTVLVTNTATSFTPVTVTNVATQAINQTATVTNLVTAYSPVVVTSVATQAVTQLNTITNAATVTATQVATVTGTITATASLTAPVPGLQKRDPQFGFLNGLISDILRDLTQGVATNVLGPATLNPGPVGKATGIPAYAAACSNTQRYSSACSCRGIGETTITIPAKNVLATVTNTVVVTPTSTVGVISTQTVTVTTVLASFSTTTLTTFSTSTVVQNVAVGTVVPVTQTAVITTTLTNILTQTIQSTVILPTTITTTITALSTTTVLTTILSTLTVTTTSTQTTSTTATAATIQPTIGPVFLMFNGGINDQSLLYSQDIGLGLNALGLLPNVNQGADFIIDQNGNVYESDISTATMYLAVAGTGYDPIIVDNLLTDVTGRVKITCAVANPSGLGGQTDFYNDVSLGRFSCVGPKGASVFVQCADAMYLSVPNPILAPGCTISSLEAWLLSP